MTQAMTKAIGRGLAAIGGTWLLASATAVACGGPVDECAAGCPRCTVCYYGSCRPDPECGDAGADDDADVPGGDDARADVDGPGPEDVRTDDAGGPDLAETGDDDGGETVADGDEAEAGEDGAPEAEADAAPPCAGASVGGFCWYAGGVAQSCDVACAAHGGCDLEGTRDYAGSGGSDANCVAVLAALGYGGYSHQDWSNNDQGCHFAWDSWTYWSAAFPTTCEAVAYGAANVVRMCACAN